MKTIILHFDGSCEPVNPGGNIGCGFYAHYEGKPESLIVQGSEKHPSSPQNSNNVAEYMALKYGLEALLSLGLSENRVEVRGDSMLVIQQMSGAWKIKKGMYKPFAVEAYETVCRFSHIAFQWIPREQNESADNLSK